MTTEVINLRDARPLLSDIPGMLRHVANQIEAGDIQATSMIAIVPRDGDWPIVFGWGEHLGDLGNIATCELAKAFFVHSLTQQD